MISIRRIYISRSLHNLNTLSDLPWVYFFENQNCQSTHNNFYMAIGDFAYIPLSCLIILLVILLTCVSRRKKFDAFDAVERHADDDVKKEYAIMCFPCLKKKPDLAEYEPTEDLSNQFEYIVEKYTIRKVPLLLANTAEDLLERQKELELSKTKKSESQLFEENATNFQIAQEVYNVQKIPPCITFGASTSYRNKSIREGSVPSDILESMSPLMRPPVRNRNYVAIPTKASLRHKDIMMTKREITNQYLNNFSSVFVDNLKDQVPKDPEQFPRLSRPYTSAFRSFPINDPNIGKICKPGKKSKKIRGSKVAYAFPLEETNIKEQPYAPESSCESDSVEDQQKIDTESQEETKNNGNGYLEKSKSLVLLNESEILTNDVENIPNPFKTILRSSTSLDGSHLESHPENDYSFSISFYKEDWQNSKNVTYEDIQALDVGYEFNSCEKLGVKPKMTRLRQPDSEINKECGKLDSSKNTSQELIKSIKSNKTVSVKLPAKPDSTEGNTVQSCNTLTLFPTQRFSSRSLFTETSFLPQSGSVDLDSQNKESFLLSTRSDDSKPRSVNEMDLTSEPPVNRVDSFVEMYQMPRPSTVPKHFSNISEFREELKFQPSSRSRSLHEAGFPSSKSGEFEVGSKGNDNSAQILTRSHEPDTETSYSFESRDSKMSSLITGSPKSSEVDEDKRATLRWKIIIKNHREDNPSKKLCKFE